VPVLSVTMSGPPVYLMIWFVPFAFKAFESTLFLYVVVNSSMVLATRQKAFCSSASPYVKTVGWGSIRMWLELCWVWSGVVCEWGVGVAVFEHVRACICGGSGRRLDHLLGRLFF